MIIGIPKEIRLDEHRVSLPPTGVEALTRRGHAVLVERGAGENSGFADGDYQAAGGRIVADPEALFAEAELVVKVKEPQPAEYPLLRPDQILFTFFHFAANRDLTQAVLASGCTAIAYETVSDAAGRLPLLGPMSEIAGRLAVQNAAKYLERPQGGRGVLLSGATGADAARVTVIGGGVAGSNAARLAAAMGARTRLLEIDPARIARLKESLPSAIAILPSAPETLAEAVADSDVIIAAVLTPGERAPRLISRAQLRAAPRGAVAVDIAIDQGGALESSRPTTHRDPVYLEEGALHYCVANMPGAVPRTASLALANATLPRLLDLADWGWRHAARRRPELIGGISMVDGQTTHPGVARAWDLPHRPIESLI